jgi:hypothetical protein
VSPALETLAERGRLPADAVVLNKPYRKADLAKRLREVVSAVPWRCARTPAIDLYQRAGASCQ